MSVNIHFAERSFFDLYAGNKRNAGFFIGKNPKINRAVAIKRAIREELGSVCERILGNTAVFKTKEQTRGFLASLGFVEAE